MDHRPWLALLLVGAPLSAQAGDARVLDRLDVRVDPRIELLSVVFRLAGNPEYSQGRVRRYSEAVDAHFGAHRDHDVVVRARRLRAARGVSFDAVAGFAVHLAGIEPPTPAQPLDPLPARLDRRWSAADAQVFLDELRDFAAQTEAAAFFAGQRDLYAHAEQALRKVLAEHADLSWFDRFFGARATARFQIAIGLLNGGANYGPSVLRPDGSEELYCVLGCWQTDADGMPMFGRPVVGTVVHEFCHSYCNPLVDAHLDALQPAGEQLYALVESAMRAQAYGNARTLLCESLVRACVVRYLTSTQDERAVAAEVAEQRSRSFLWVGELAELLARFERQRAESRTLDDFVPELVPFFREQVPKVTAQLAKRPKVVGIAPANGADDVDPATTALRITFDRPMRDQSWSVVGGGEHFPRIGTPAYDEQRQVLTLPVTLKPDWHYELWLNQGRYDSFQSADGEPLEPLRVTFRTRPAGEQAR
jgi:hypothetical protein